MASNPPPFQVEDTDEDFFDKLVEDDLGPPPPSGPKLNEGSDSDDGKAFANLSVGDSTAVSADSGAEKKEEKRGVDLDAKEAEEADSFGFDNVIESSDSINGSAEGVIESNNDRAGAQLKSDSDSTVSKSNDSGVSGVKQVDWGSFYANSAQNGSHGFGSYSDFFNELGDNSGDFPAKVEENLTAHPNIISGSEDYTANGLNNSVHNQQYQEVQGYGTSVEENKNEQDVNSTEYWESLYPGWKFDSNTGQWYQVDSFDVAPNVQGSLGDDSATNWATVTDTKTEVSYLQQTAHSVAGTVTEASTTGSLSSWDQVSQGTNGYPEHMLFNPEYPGWYYDTIAQEWRALEAYNSSVQGTATTAAQAQNDNSIYGEYRQADNYGSQGVSNQGQDGSWSGSYNTYNQQTSNMWQPEAVATSESFPSFGGNQHLGNSFASTVNKDQQKSVSSFGAAPLYNKASQGHGEANGTVGLQSFVPGGNFNQQFNQGNAKLNEQTQFSDDYYGSQKPVNYSQQSFQSGNQFSYAPSVGRSSAGRPPHALVTFGFGGKLIVMKDNSSLRNSSYGSQVRPLKPSRFSIFNSIWLR